MNETKQDRRVRRTQKLLKDSLICLMQKKEFKNISVKDITELADLNRGTFYLHYSDTYHLLQEIEKDVLDSFQEMIDGSDLLYQADSLLPLLQPVIDYISENTAICQILFENNASTDFLNRFHRLIHQNGLKIVQSLYDCTDSETTECFFEFVTYGLIGMLRRWIHDGQNIPKERLAKLANRAITGTAARLLINQEIPSVSAKPV